MTNAPDTEHRPLPDDAVVMTPYGPCTVKWVREHDLSYWTEKLADARANVAKYRRLIGIPDTGEEVRDELVRALANMSGLIASAGIHHLSRGVELGAMSWAAKMFDAANAASAALSRAKVQP